ncbi:Olfactory receptor 5AC1 [Lemmus lemmus]
MTVENQTLVAELVLVGLTEQPRLQVPLFLVFLIIYLITMVGNLGLIALIWKDPHLHIPMYLFLDHKIFLAECFTQFYFFGSSATTECFLLSAMAYDRYVAICNPLLYPVMMSNSLCMQFIHVSYVVGFLHSAIHYFYCEILQLFKISCTDPTINVLLVLIFSAFIQGFTFMTIIISYFYVLFAILKTKSEKGRSKAFSTCSSHLLSVFLFYGTLFLMYVRPGSGSGENNDKMYSLFYTIIIPFLNPFIYSLRNKEVITALRRKMKK